MVLKIIGAICIVASITLVFAFLIALLLDGHGIWTADWMGR